MHPAFRAHCHHPHGINIARHYLRAAGVLFRLGYLGADSLLAVRMARGVAESMWCHCELEVAADLGKRVYSLDMVSDLRPHPLSQSVQGIMVESGIDASIQRLAGSGTAAAPRGRMGSRSVQRIGPRQLPGRYRLGDDG
jgi:hypothetical protein